MRYYSFDFFSNHFILWKPFWGSQIQKQTVDQIRPVNYSLSINPHSRPNNSFGDFNHQTLHIYEEFNMKGYFSGIKKRISLNLLFLILMEFIRKLKVLLRCPVIVPRKRWAQRNAEQLLTQHFQTTSSNIHSHTTLQQRLRD